MKSGKRLYYLFILLVIGSVLVVNYQSYRHFFRLDLTENHQYTIASGTRDILKNLNDYITVELYFSENLPPQFQKMKEDVKDVVTEFKVFGGKKLKVVWRTPRENSVDKQSALSLGLEQVQLPLIEKDRETVVKVIAGVAVRYADRTEIIPLLRETSGFEYDLIKRISMVLKPERPRIGVLRTDNFQEDATKFLYGDMIKLLESEYTVEYVDISKTYPIDPGIQALVVPGGDDPFWRNPFPIAAIDQYFMKGGKLIVCANRIAVNLQSSPDGKRQDNILFELLQKYGVDVRPQLVADFSCDVMQLQQNVNGETKTYPMDYPYFIKVSDAGLEKGSPAVSGFQGMIIPWASPVFPMPNLPKTVKADTVLMSGAESFVMNEPLSLNPRIYWDKRATQAKAEKRWGQVPLALHLRGEFHSIFEKDTTTDQIVRSVKSNDLLVIGNSSFLTAGKLDHIFMKNLVDWMTSNDQLISIRNRTFVDRSFRTSKWMSEKVRATTYRVVNIVLMPLLLILVGIVIFVKRKRAQKREGVL